MTDTPAPFDPEAFRALMNAALARFGRQARAQIEARIATLQPLGEWARAQMEASLSAAATIGRAFQLRDERDQARDEAGRLTGELVRAEMEIERLRGQAPATGEPGELEA